MPNRAKPEGVEMIRVPLHLVTVAVSAALSVGLAYAALGGGIASNADDIEDNAKRIERFEDISADVNAIKVAQAVASTERKAMAGRLGEIITALEKLKR